MSVFSSTVSCVPVSLEIATAGARWKTHPAFTILLPNPRFFFRPFAMFMLCALFLPSSLDSLSKAPQTTLRYVLPRPLRGGVPASRCGGFHDPVGDRASCLETDKQPCHGEIFFAPQSLYHVYFLCDQQHYIAAMIFCISPRAAKACFFVALSLFVAYAIEDLSLSRTPSWSLDSSPLPTVRLVSV